MLKYQANKVSDKFARTKKAATFEVVKGEMMLRIFYVVILVSFPCVCYTQQNLCGWHIQGQTFLIWEHSGVVPSDTTYEIYTSSQPITSIGNATWIGRVFADNGANKRLYEYVPDARWKLPNTSGGAVAVDTNEAYFVVTPYITGTAYYAVVAYGDTVVTSTNTAGPIEETVEPVGVVIQYQDTAVTIYAHWIDGGADYDSGRPDYPIMGNEYSNGIGFNFAVWEPEGGRPAGDLPLVVALHGGTMDLWMYAPYNHPAGVYVKMSDGLLVCLDDPLRSKHFLMDYVNSFWVGYNTEYNRFSPLLPSDTATVVNYTVRRVLWEIDWLINNLPIDSTRIAMLGASMGGYGTLIYTQFYPEIFSAGLAFVAPVDGPQITTRFKLIGTETQNLPTNFDGFPGIYDVVHGRWRVYNLQQSGYDWPFTLLVCGKNDSMAGWSSETTDWYRDLDSAKTGFALYWDERTHLYWDASHWFVSEHIHAAYLAQFRNDQSFPAFSNTDLDLVTPGRQPDPGNGNPMDGDPWGTWGGYLEWDTGGIVDTADKWSVTMWVTYQSIYPNDIPDADTILADVTPRRLQQFQPQAGHTYSWNLIRVLNGDTLQEGTVSADSSGIITVPGLLLIKEPITLTIWGSIGLEEEQNLDAPILIYQSYPNPFTQKTVIEVKIVGVQYIEPLLQIYDLTGRLVKTFLITNIQSPITKVAWNGRDENKRLLPSGIYFVKLKAGCHSEQSEESQTKKLLLL